jgi:hypothetical protein
VECPFYAVAAPLRFYTTKTRCGHFPVVVLPSSAEVPLKDGFDGGRLGTAPRSGFVKKCLEKLGGLNPEAYL